MRYTWHRFLKTFAAVSAVAVIGLVVFELASVLEPRIRMRVDAQRNPLVVFVVIDALRRDHIETLGSQRATTPDLARLAKEGFVASGMLAHSSQTAPSVASMFVSKAPHAHGVQFDPRTRRFGNNGKSKAPVLAESNLTLAEVMSGEEYFTAAIVANPWLREEFGFAQGFDQYVEIPCHKRGRGVCDGARINEEASKVIRNHAAEKTLLYLHYLDVHNPYAHAGKLPRVFRNGPGRVVYRNGKAEGVSSKDLAYTIDAYDDGLLYTDSLIGQLVGELESVAAERDVLLVITSDHGDEFLEHGGLGHGSTLYPELLETFAIFWRPDGRMRHPRDERLSGTIDIAPTLLDLVGIGKPSEMAGRSLLGSSSARPIIAELAGQKAAIKEHWGVIRDLDARQDEVVAYSATAESEPSAELFAELSSLLDSLDVRSTVNSAAPDPEVVQQLKALGYME